MKRLLPLILLCGLATITTAQKEVDFDSSPGFKERIFFGGGLGFSGSNQQTNITLSPIVGYMITQQWSAGVGITYQYIKLKNYDISDNLWGGNVFTRYSISQFFAQAEYDYINFDPNLLDDQDDRDSATRFLLGGGISQPLGNRGSVNLLAMYDLTYNNNSPYDSPWVFRVYFSF